MRVWFFEIDEFAIINRNARYGLPDGVGKLASITERLEHGSYDYRIKLSDGSYTKVKESELNKVDPDDIVLQINIGDTVVRPDGEEAEIVLIDYLHNQIEVEYQDGTFEVLNKNKFIREIR